MGLLRMYKDVHTVLHVLELLNLDVVKYGITFVK